MPTINFLNKNHDKLLKYFMHESYVIQNTSKGYDWDGHKSLTIMTPEPVDLQTYTRDANLGDNYGKSRFGQLSEAQDSIQVLTMAQEDTFNFTIDRSNYNDQAMKKKANEYLQLELKSKMVPKRDKHALSTYCAKAGIIKNNGVEPLSKNSIVEAIFNANAALDNALVPEGDRYLYIPVSEYVKLKTSDYFQYDGNMVGNVFKKGRVGTMVDGTTVIRVPDWYFPTGVQFVLTYKGSVIAPQKFQTARIITDDKDVDGWIIQGHNYYDSFVLNAWRKGVYVATLATGLVAPTAAPTEDNCVISMTLITGQTCYYTLDGSDPGDEFNDNRLKWVGPTLTINAGQEFKYHIVEDDNSAIPLEGTLVGTLD